MIENITDKVIVKQYLDLNYSEAKMSYGIVTYKRKNIMEKINQANLIWELKADGIIADYELLKTILPKNI